MEGGDYVKGKSGMALISDVMNTMLFTEFIKEESLVELVHSIEHTVTESVILLDSNEMDSFKQSWEVLKNDQKELMT